MNGLSPILYAQKQAESLSKIEPSHFLLQNPSIPPGGDSEAKNVPLGKSSSEEKIIVCGCPENGELTSGYGSHFAEIGLKYGGFDLVVLENGQYDEIWSAIHIRPEEVLMASIDLKAKLLFPVHSGKFALAFHPWDEPLQNISDIHMGSKYSFPLLTPLIGEIVCLDDSSQQFSKWWQNLQ